jgi:hypothetical protein
MLDRKRIPLATGYTAEVDSINEHEWYHLAQRFDDNNIYQTWPYGCVIGGHRNVSHFALRLFGDAVAVAQVRIKSLRVLGIGVAYVQWGPIWRRTGTGADAEIFRQAIRGMRNEYTCKRGLTLRIFPLVFEEDSLPFNAYLAEEGFSPVGTAARGRTILMDLSPSLIEIREGMAAHWKRELKVAEKNNLELMEGSNEELFEQFIDMYREMVSRKKFVEPNDINQFRQIQMRLPEESKMKILLCKSSAGMSAGSIYSVGGNSAIYLFGATSNNGMKSRGSYFLQWKIVEALKKDGVAVYNLNGINPEKNPGTYKFKNDLAGKHGRDVSYVGRYDAHAGQVRQLCIEGIDSARLTLRKLRGFLHSRRDQVRSLIRAA